MTEFKLLIDTNIFIGLEDPKAVDPRLAELSRKCSTHGIRLFVHELAKTDVARDRNAERQKISLSKLLKFQLLSGIKPPAEKLLEAEFGKITRPNDVVDVCLLYALKIGAVDFVITQDQGLHGRVKGNPLARQVLTIENALAWISQTFEPTTVDLPYIEEHKAHEIDLHDEIFKSLRDGYPDFDNWWREKCIKDHRQCWTINIGGEIAGLVVRKDETQSEARTRFGGQKILKICTFKVKSKFWGEKLGEQLLKQILWFAQRNAYDLIYLTTFPNQTFLIQALEYYGFEQTLRRDNGELFFEKILSRNRLVTISGEQIYETDRKNYPRFIADNPAQIFCVPIQGQWHRKLFPELAEQTALPLFPELKSFIASSNSNRVPGNTIRKVYLCRAQTDAVHPGDLLLFYQSKSPSFVTSQCLTSIGVTEDILSTDNFDELVRMTAKRSVFSEHELRELIEANEKPIKVINFLLAGHLNPPIALSQLIQMGVFANQPPQSIIRLPQSRFDTIKPYLNLGFNI